MNDGETDMVTRPFEITTEFETPAWKQQMEACGISMRQHFVREVVFVHGTFVGEDPFGILAIFKSLGVSERLTELCEKQGKKLTDSTMDDLGNFVEDYSVSFAKAINNNINCRRFNWSSENNHIGRLLSVISLAKDLATHIDRLEQISEHDRVLLIGHSHAGQLFALLTVFLENDTTALALLELLQETRHFDQDQFREHLNKISNVYLDFVTLGTPVRYRWGRYHKYSLLNIVNHRSDSKLDGIMQTRDGDYVQQWGVEGTDLLPSKPSFISINKKLDHVLDKGVSSPSNVISYIYMLIIKKHESKRRLARITNGNLAGSNIFVDYTDNGNDPVETLFGHGAYTKKQNMLFNAHIIVSTLYNKVFY